MDRSPLDYAHTLEGEHMLRADTFRREARHHEEQAKALKAQAEDEEKRALWARSLAAALEGSADAA